MDCKMRRGFLLAEAMITVIIAGVIAAIFSAISYYTYIQSNLLKRQNTTMILEVVRSRLLALAGNPDGDPYYELPKEGTSNGVPVNAGMVNDAWGRAIRYYPIDLGNPNTFDATLTNNTTAISPNANIVGRLLSAGDDGVFSTTATDSAAKGDDVMLEIGIGETNHYKLYGGSDIATQTRGYNSAIISNTAPTNPIDGTLWYDRINGVMKVYDVQSLSWIVVP